MHVYIYVANKKMNGFMHMAMYVASMCQASMHVYTRIFHKYRFTDYVMQLDDAWGQVVIDSLHKLQDLIISYKGT